MATRDSAIHSTEDGSAITELEINRKVVPIL